MVDNNNNIYLTNNVSTDEKMKFYNAAINNDLELFKTLLLGDNTKEHYNIFEEVSASGYNWTVFHYAMHYGRWEIIKFIIEYLSQNNMIDIAFNMKTKDNRCPMLCLLKSKDLTNKEKKELYFKIVNSFQIPINAEVIDEANKRDIYEEDEAVIKNIYKEENNKNPYIINELTQKEKNNFYKSIKVGDLNLFKSYLFGNEERKPYNIFEEVSEPGYNWTVFHYAMHYGKWEIIKFIIEYLSENNMIDIALNMKTSDGRCPLLCIIRSEDLKLEEKKDIFIKIILNFNIPINDEVKKELLNKNMEDLLMD